MHELLKLVYALLGSIVTTVILPIVGIIAAIALLFA